MSRPHSRRRLGITVAAWAVVLPAAVVLPGALPAPADFLLPAGPPASVTAPDTIGALETVVAGAPDPAVDGAVPLGSDLATVPAGTAGIPGIVLEAYRSAERSMAGVDGACGLTWPLLAGIGRVESGHARGGRVDAAGTTLTPILGPVLAGGPGMAAISDTDGGRMDGNATWDRAVGPMQFIPSTWRGYAADGNADGVSNAHNVHDAALAAGRYLCIGAHDLRTVEGASAALFRYNRSTEYVRKVLALAAAYARGVAVLPDTSASGVDASPVPPPVRAAAVQPLAPQPPAPQPLAPQQPVQGAPVPVVEGGPATPTAPPTSTTPPPTSTTPPPTSTTPPPTSTTPPPTSTTPPSTSTAPPSTSTTARAEATQDTQTPTKTTTAQPTATPTRTTTTPPPPAKEPATGAAGAGGAAGADGAGADGAAGAPATCRPVDPAAPPPPPTDPAAALPPC